MAGFTGGNGDTEGFTGLHIHSQCEGLVGFHLNVGGRQYIRALLADKGGGYGTKPEPLQSVPINPLDMPAKFIAACIGSQTDDILNEKLDRAATGPADEIPLGRIAPQNQLGRVAFPDGPGPLVLPGKSVKIALAGNRGDFIE